MQNKTKICALFWTWFYFLKIKCLLLFHYFILCLFPFYFHYFLKINCLFCINKLKINGFELNQSRIKRSRFNWAFLCSCTKNYRKVPPDRFNSMTTRFLPQFKPKIRFEVRFQFDTVGDTQHTEMFIMKIDFQATSISVDFGWNWKKGVSNSRHL